MFASGIEWNPTELYSTCYHVFHHHKSTEKKYHFEKNKVLLSFNRRNYMVVIFAEFRESDKIRCNHVIAFMIPLRWVAELENMKLLDKNIDNN